jgi:hypothetical protein
MIACSLNLLSAKANQAAGLAAQKGGKMTVFSFCRASPSPNQDHQDEDDSGNENGQDGHQGQGEKIHKLYNCVLKFSGSPLSRVEISSKIV